MAATKDKLLEAIEAVHAAGLDEELWPKALGAASRLVGGSCATFETLETPSLQHRRFLGFNIPPANELLYLREYVPLSPRTRFAARRRAGELIWDYQMMSEAAMDRDPFYMEFLRKVDLRYFFGGVIANDGRDMTAVTFHRARKFGHAERNEIALIRRIIPHFQQAYDVAQRLKEARSRAGALQAALDWLADGVALLAADGTVLYANEALQRIFRRNDGIRIAKRAIAFAGPDATARLASALGSVVRLRTGDAGTAAMHDFSVSRPLIESPYLLSLRPILHGDIGRSGQRAPAAVLFVHDPSPPEQRGPHALRDALRLTAAEAKLAQALQEGASVAGYARELGLSLNTAYTHLRRIKEKTGCKRLPELIRRLNDLRVPLRRDT